jgi:EamA domain-containing membrane protein RarD
LSFIEYQIQIFIIYPIFPQFYEVLAKYSGKFIFSDRLLFSVYQFNSIVRFLAQRRSPNFCFNSVEKEDAAIYVTPVKDSVASAAVSGRKNQDNILVKG